MVLNWIIIIALEVVKYLNKYISGGGPCRQPICTGKNKVGILEFDILENYSLTCT